MPCHAISGPVLSRHAMSCHVHVNVHVNVDAVVDVNAHAMANGYVDIDATGNANPNGIVDVIYRSCKCSCQPCRSYYCQCHC